MRDSAKLLGLLLFVQLCTLGAEAPNLAWAQAIGGIANDFAGGIAVDSQGGIFYGSYMQDGFVGSQKVNNAYILQKFNSSGERLWYRLLPASSPNIRSKLLVDRIDRLLVLFGSSGLQFHDFQRQGITFARYNVDLAPVWVNGQGSFGGENTPFDMTLDPEGNFVATIPLSSQPFRFGNSSLVAPTGSSIAVLKIKPTGELIWSRRSIGGTSATSIGTDVEGNIYITGSYNGTIGFETTVLPNSGTFLVKFNPSGDLLWARNVSPYTVTPFTLLRRGNDGEMLMLGLSPGNFVVDSKTFSPGAFLSRWSSSGTVLGVTPLQLSVAPRFAEVDEFGDLLLAGEFTGTSVLGRPVLNRGGKDIYVAKRTFDGSVRWVKTMGHGSDADELVDISVGPDRAIHLAGNFQGATIIDNRLLEGITQKDAFLAKFSPEIINLPQIVTAPLAQLAAVGSSVTLRVEASGIGPLTYQWYFNGAAIPNATNEVLSIPNVTLSSGGNYFVEVRGSGGAVRTAPAQLTIRGQVPVRVTTTAGSLAAGLVDSTNSAAARFHYPDGLEHLTGGIVAVADGYNHAIRLVDSSGWTATLAGRGEPGLANGPGTVALFNFPLGLNIDRSLDILVADSENNVIRRVSTFGLRNVTTIAGDSVAGYRDGPASLARFHFPNDLVVDPDGNIFVTEFTNHTVRRISSDGMVTTFAGNGTAGFRDGIGTNAAFNMPAGIEIDGQQNLYVTDWMNHAIRKITPKGLVTTLAGTNTPGLVDGKGSEARFKAPNGITIDPLGNLYVTERENHTIRKIDSIGNVVLLAGLGAAGYRDGDGTVAQFNSPNGIAWHPDGSLWIGDSHNNVIRRLQFIGATSSVGAELLLTLNPALTVFGEVGAIYRIEAAESSVNGVPMDWTALDTVRLDTGVIQWFDPNPATRGKRFYRAVKVE